MTGVADLHTDTARTDIVVTLERDGQILDQFEIWSRSEPDEMSAEEHMVQEIRDTLSEDFNMEHISEVVVSPERWHIIWRALNKVMGCNSGWGGVELHSFTVPPRWSRNLGRVERILKSLTQQEFDDFCEGDQDMIERVTARGCWHAYTSRFLNAFFMEGWR